MSIKLTLLNFCRLVIFLAWPFFLLLTVVSLLFSPATVEKWHSSQGHPLRQEKQLFNKNVFNYLIGNQKLASQFKKRERAHLKEVKALVRLTFFLRNTTFFLLLLALLALIWQKQLTALPQLFIVGGLSFTGLLLVLLFLALTSFSTLFNYFHLLFFRHNSWLFPQRSLLIQLYPYNFWLQTALVWFTLTGLLLLSVSLIFFLSRQKNS